MGSECRVYLAQQAWEMRRRKTDWNKFFQQRARQVAGDAVLKALRNGAPAAVLVRLLRRWAGWYGEAEMSVKVRRVLEDADVVELGIQAWVPTNNEKDEDRFETSSVQILQKVQEVPDAKVPAFDLKIASGLFATLEPASVAVQHVRRLEFFVGESMPNCCSLLQAGHFGNLDTLVVRTGRRSRGVEWEPLLRALGSGCPGIRTLDLAREGFDTEACKVFAEVIEGGGLRQLLFLDVEGNDIGLRGIRALLRGLDKLSLRKLNLADNRIGNAGCSEMASALEKNMFRSLKILDIGNNRADDYGYSMVLRALHNRAARNLRELGLMGYRLDARWTSALRSSRRSLQILDDGYYESIPMEPFF